MMIVLGIVLIVVGVITSPMIDKRLSNPLSKISGMSTALGIVIVIIGMAMHTIK